MGKIKKRRRLGRAPVHEQSVKPKEKMGFSKVLLIQESVLIWIMTLVFLYLAYLCIKN